MKEIPKKNYFILAIIVVLTILLVFYLKSWYEATTLSNLPRTIMADSLPEVKIEEFDNFIQENPNIVIYISSSTENQGDFDKKIYQYISKNNLKQNFVYMNKDEVTIEQLKDLQEKYASDLIKKQDISNIPNFYLIHEGQIVDYYNTNGQVDYNEAVKFLEEAELR